jgi:hypothetical protein
MFTLLEHHSLLSFFSALPVEHTINYHYRGTLQQEYNVMTKRQAMIHQTLSRKLMIEQLEAH